MSSCVHCGGSKGKRACPALGGEICPPCCGRHRLVDIACPPGCRWLGGLAAVRDPGASFTRDEYRAAVEKLNAYSLSPREAAARAAALAYFRDTADETGWVAALAESGEAHDWLPPLVEAFVAYGARDASGARAVDRLIALHGRSLVPGEAAALGAIARSWAALLEVVDVRPGTGFTARDRLHDEQVEVREVTATAQLRRGDTLFAWLMEVDGHLELTGALTSLPPPLPEAVEAIVREELGPLRAARPDVAPKHLLAELADVVVVTLGEYFARRRSPALVTGDGEPLLLCRAHYTISDAREARARLAARPELDDDGDALVWLDRGGAGHPTVLGWLRLTDGELVLETASRARLAAGRALVEATLGALATHRADALEDPTTAARAPAPARASDLPPEVEAQLVREYVAAHYARWVDERLPALDGATPREAVATAAGQRRVAAMIADIERTAAAMPGADGARIADQLRRELGLAPPGDGLTYDADEAPDPATWLAADEGERDHAIRAHHAARAPHAPAPNEAAHATMHQIVENQLAAGDPPEAAEAIARLIGAGATRHAAVHAVGSAVAAEVSAVVAERRAYDRRRVARALARLRASDWRLDG